MTKDCRTIEIVEIPHELYVQFEKTDKASFLSLTEPIDPWHKNLELFLMSNKTFHKVKVKIIDIEIKYLDMLDSTDAYIAGYNSTEELLNELKNRFTYIDETNEIIITEMEII